MTSRPPVDAQRFREVLGNYPTGVTVVTAMDADGFPAGMAVGSFTSVSLDPPLVAFLADKSSTSFPRIRTADSFCVNVLAADQEDVCRTFASRGGDKFASVAWTPTGSGAPRINGVAAWIDCKLESVQEAGDHYLVIGRVRELDSTGERLPLVFFQGGYGRFLPLSLVAVPEVDFVSHLRLADRCRPEMELLAAEVGAECLALTPVDDQLVVLASAGAPGGGVQFSRVGQRIPFVPPVGTLFLAWAEHDAVLGWLARSGRALSDAERDEQLTVLERVRRRGWSLEPAREFESQHESAPDDGADDEAAGRVISVPVFGVRGSVLLTLTLWGLAEADPEEVVRRWLGTLRAAAERISASLRERPV